MQFTIITQIKTQPYQTAAHADSWAEAHLLAIAIPCFLKKTIPNSDFLALYVIMYKYKSN